MCHLPGQRNLGNPLTGWAVTKYSQAVSFDMVRAAALVATGAVLAGVATAGAARADPPGPPSYGASGTFVVSTQHREWTGGYIPPGRYQVLQDPIWTPLPRAPGFWERCNDLPCSPTFPDHIIATGSPAESDTLDILPTDTAVYLFNTQLNVAG